MYTLTNLLGSSLVTIHIISLLSIVILIELLIVTKSIVSTKLPLEYFNTLEFVPLSFPGINKNILVPSDTTSMLFQL
jgi:hypothetical protein